MKLIPAIDIINNQCVRMNKGREESMVIYNNNPINQAKFFEREGCERIHIVDLDSAFGRVGINKKTILDIRQSVSIPIELGGGIRDYKDIVFWINNNIDFIIIGSLAVKDSKNVISIANDLENKIYISLDQLENKIMIKGWVESSLYSTKEIINIYNKSKIKGFIFTDIARDGMMEGININLVRENLSICEKPMIVGGGLSNYEDLEKLKNLNNNNLEGVIAGKSFYSGSIQIKKGLQILKKNA